MSKPFTDEQKTWLVENNDKYRSYSELTQAFNERFGTSYTWAKHEYSPIERLCRRIGLKRFSTDYGFTKEEDKWLKEYAPRFSNRWLANNIKNVSGRNHSEEAIKMHIREWLGIQKGNGGVREDTVLSFKMPIGSLTSLGKRGVRIKIQDTGDDKKDWYSYPRYVYEKHHNVKLTDDYQVIRLDGDCENFDPNNLIAVTHQEHAILTANGWHSSGEITRTGATWAKLSLLMKHSEHADEL